MTDSQNSPLSSLEYSHMNFISKSSLHLHSFIPNVKSFENLYFYTTENRYFEKIKIQGIYMVESGIGYGDGGEDGEVWLLRKVGLFINLVELFRDLYFLIDMKN